MNHDPVLKAPWPVVRLASHPLFDDLRSRQSTVCKCVILVLVVLSADMVPTKLIAQEEHEAVLEPDQMIADVEQLLDVLEEVHPDPYYHISPQKAREAQETLLSSLEKPLSRSDFYSLLARFISRFQDGHFAITPPLEDLRKHLDNGGKIFPLDVDDTTEGLIVKHVYQDDSPLQPGDRLLTINGIATETLFNEFLLEQSGERRYRAERACAAFRQLLWIHSVREPFVVKWSRSIQGNEQTTRLDGVDLATYIAKRNERRAQSYRFEVLDGRVGLIDFRSMNDSDKFSAFLKETFKRVRDESIKGMIVDLRHNGGGNSALGDVLLSYITAKPYRMASRKQWKVSESYKQYLVNHGVQDRRYLEATVGETVVYKANLKTPPENPLRFEGPVCFLIGRGTYSSAVMLANAVEDFELATLIGDETGGCPNEFGEIYRFELTHSKLDIHVSTAQWIRANGDANDKHGVLPDIPTASIGDKVQDVEDPLLEFARIWALSQRQVQVLPDQ